MSKLRKRIGDDPEFLKNILAYGNRLIHYGVSNHIKY